MLAEEYGIVPAGMLGHSAGEIACGYADGGLTREQVPCRYPLRLLLVLVAAPNSNNNAVSSARAEGSE